MIGRRSPAKIRYRASASGTRGKISGGTHRTPHGPGLALATSDCSTVSTPLCPCYLLLAAIVVAGLTGVFKRA